jgi:hypothetical protein
MSVQGTWGFDRERTVELFRVLVDACQRSASWHRWAAEGAKSPNLAHDLTRTALHYSVRASPASLRPSSVSLVAWARAARGARPTRTGSRR